MDGYVRCSHWRFAKVKRPLDGYLDLCRLPTSGLESGVIFFCPAEIAQFPGCGSPFCQTLGTAQSLLKMAGLPWAAPDYSTVCRRQKGLDVQVHYRPSRKR